jgi:hypothetical protein
MLLLLMMMMGSAFSHTPYESKNCNRVTFSEYIIIHFDDITQPAKPPDVSGCKLYSLGTLEKQSVCKQTSHYQRAERVHHGQN